MQNQSNCVYQSEDSIICWAKGCSGNEIDYIKSIECILHKDYPRMSFVPFRNKMAWDVDGYEISIKRGTYRSETVDFVVGLANNQMLMVEAKLRVVNVENIKSEIEDKISKTKRYLVSSTSFNSYSSPSIVLFGNKNNDFERNKNKFIKLRNYKRDIMPMLVDDFYNKYFNN